MAKTLKNFEKLGVLACNLVPHTLPFEAKLVLKSLRIFRNENKIGISDGVGGHGPMASPVYASAVQIARNCTSHGLYVNLSNYPYFLH